MDGLFTGNLKNLIAKGKGEPNAKNEDSLN